jgi:hypothetical protein
MPDISEMLFDLTSPTQDQLRGLVADLSDKRPMPKYRRHLRLIDAHPRS